MGCNPADPDPALGDAAMHRLGCALKALCPAGCATDMSTSPSQPRAPCSPSLQGPKQRGSSLKQGPALKGSSEPPLLPPTSQDLVSRPQHPGTAGACRHRQLVTLQGLQVNSAAAPPAKITVGTRCRSGRAVLFPDLHALHRAHPVTSLPKQTQGRGDRDPGRP